MKILIFTLIFLTTGLYATVYTVGDAADVNCDFNEIQDALDSGNSGMEIRVTHQKVYSPVLIDDKDVISLDGGYATCSDADAGIRPVDFTSSEIDGTNSAIGMNIDYDTMMFNTINISGFDIYNGNPSGIKVKSSGGTSSLVVFIEKSSAHNNADHGMEVVGEFSRAEFQGKIYDNVNQSAENIRGGGIYCSGAIFTLNQNSSIYGNSAGLGGGIYTNNCSVSIFASGDMNALDSLEYGIFDNHAFAYGGGIRFDNSFVFITGSATSPVSISHNSSGNNGGGIYLSNNNFVEMVNSRIDGNTATNNGGGMYVYNFNGGPNDVTLSQVVDGCDYAEICSSMSYNSVATSNLSIYGGGAIHALGENSVNINQTVLEGNLAKYGAVYYGEDGSTLSMEGDLLIHNQRNENGNSAYSLFHTKTSPATHINYTTIADNKVLDIYVNSDESASVFNMTKSIVEDENDADLIIPVDMAGANVHCSIIHNNSSSSLYDADTVVGSANLIKSADYKLSLGSIAIDPVCANNPVPEYEDIRAFDRLTDGNADIGAYEFIESDDVIFRDGF